MQIKKGDLVRYRGWSKYSEPGPLALVVEVRSLESHYHSRIRVVWTGEEIPVQASVISTSGSRLSSWCAPKYFELVSEC